MSAKSCTRPCSSSWSTSDAPRPSMFIAERDAKCSRLRRRRAGHDVFSQRQTTSSSSRCSALPHTGQTVGICHGLLPSGCGRIAFTTFGMTSPPFSMSTGSPSRRSFARDVLGVVQRRHRDRRSGEKDRLEHGVRRHGARAADVDGNPQELRVACCAGNLNAVAHRGNFAVVPSLRAQREIVDLDDDAVGVEARACGASRPIPGRTPRPRRSRRSASSAARQAGPRRASRRSVAAVRRGSPPSGRPRADRKTPEAALRDQRRVEVPHRARRGVARVGEERLAGLFALLVHPLERRARDR